MSIQSEINRINNNVQESLDVCRDAGVSVASDANSNDLPGATRALASSFLPLSGGTVSGVLTVTGGAKISGRAAGGGDDEGLVIGRAPNNYAGLCLGVPTGVRSVFYLLPDSSAKWRYVGSSGTASDITHPGKAGTIALTDDIPRDYLPNTGGTLSGSTTMADGSQYKFTSGAATRGSTAGSLVLSGDSSNGKTGGVFIRPTSTSYTSDGVKIIGGAILPENVGNMNLGASNAQWKDLYLAGILSDGTKSIAIKDIFPVSGGTLTGNLSGHYIKGTWLQTLSDNHSSEAASEVCVQIGGWIYKRTNNEFRADLGGTADTNYTTLQTRGTSLHASDTNPSVNGAICWTYK